MRRTLQTATPRRQPASAPCITTPTAAAAAAVAAPEAAESAEVGMVEVAASVVGLSVGVRHLRADIVAAC